MHLLFGCLELPPRRHRPGPHAPSPRVWLCFFLVTVARGARRRHGACSSLVVVGNVVPALYPGLIRVHRRGKRCGEVLPSKDLPIVDQIRIAQRPQTSSSSKAHCARGYITPHHRFLQLCAASAGAGAALSACKAIGSAARRPRATKGPRARSCSGSATLAGAHASGELVASRQAKISLIDLRRAPSA